MDYDTKITLEKVKRACRSYENGLIKTSELQSVLSWAVVNITNYQYNDLRSFFRSVENDVDFERVMLNETDFMYQDGYVEIENPERILPIIEKVIKRCDRELGV